MEYKQIQLYETQHYDPNPHISFPYLDAAAMDAHLKTQDNPKQDDTHRKNRTK